MAHIWGVCDPFFLGLSVGPLLSVLPTMILGSWLLDPPGALAEGMETNWC